MGVLLKDGVSRFFQEGYWRGASVQGAYGIWNDGFSYFVVALQET